MIVSSHPKARADEPVRRAGRLHALPRVPAALAAVDLVQGAARARRAAPAPDPDHPTLDNYRDALTENGLLHAALQSSKVATATALITTLVGLPAAYVLARQRGMISKLGLGWILLSQMFPLILIIIPLFLLLRACT